MRVPAGMLLCGKERYERSASPRREDEAKTSFVRPFQGKVSLFLSLSLSLSRARASDESTRSERSFARTAARSCRIEILGYILARTRS